ncbi:Putative NTF2-like domain superfamily protein [Septoria linicola]|uniref:NTF2-like domain superfamily protein n=1 Tax=Septoria linicola TaxID=215465 RepID=A0A9Q9EF88_9PEZI|nr:putative NTF2-like domain superfamily protein [Septoria linicola]USW47699.1 Putative NTF2-like domain superfamily protein [Septoria linicola]
MSTEQIDQPSQKVESAPEASQIPDYLASPNAVFGDKGVQWRYGRAPDYTKTRKVWAEGKTMNHASGSLEEMVENLVKNWEVEASFKPRLSDWRTIDHEKYSFAMGGGPTQTAEEMIKVGTYNAIIAPNEYYSPENSDFASSHKTFKRMMPTFAWEVLEVYSGPPRVAFRWRHWGVMKNDYVGFNDKGEKVTAKAHGGLIDIEGVTVAEVDDKVRLQVIQTWMDPLEMFRQIAPQGVVNKQTMNRKVDMEAALDIDASNTSGTVSGSASDSHGTTQNHPISMTSEHPGEIVEATSESQDRTDSQSYLGKTATDGPMTKQTPSRPVTTGATAIADKQMESSAQKIVADAASQGPNRSIECPASNAKGQSDVIPPHELSATAPKDVNQGASDDVPRSIYSSSITGNEEDVIKAAKRGEVVDESKATGTYDEVDQHLERSADQVHPHPKDVEKSTKPEAGEAVAAGPDTEETRLTHEELSRISPGECPFLMNRE